VPCRTSQDVHLGLQVSSRQNPLGILTLLCGGIHSRGSFREARLDKERIG
jgi:hypothetical protein